MPPPRTRMRTEVASVSCGTGKYFLVFSFPSLATLTTTPFSIVRTNIAVCRATQRTVSGIFCDALLPPHSAVNWSECNSSTYVWSEARILLCLLNTAGALICCSSFLYGRNTPTRVANRRRPLWRHRLPTPSLICWLIGVAVRPLSPVVQSQAVYRRTRHLITRLLRYRQLRAWLCVAMCRS